MKISLSEHTLDVNVRKCNVDLFDFSEVEEYVRTLVGDREYQFKAIKELMIYLWGGAYDSLTDLARDRKSTRLNSSHTDISRMPSSA